MVLALAMVLCISHCVCLCVEALLCARVKLSNDIDGSIENATIATASQLAIKRKRFSK